MKLKQLLKDPKKRRQFLIAGGAIAVLVILLVLHKKSGGTPAAAEPESKATTEPLSLPAEQGGGGGTGSGSANGDEQLGSEIGNAIANQSAAAAQENAATQGEIAGLAAALQGAYTNTTPGAGEPATAPPQTKTPLAKANMLVNQQANNVRQGDEYKESTYKGKNVHEYLNAAGKPKAVPGGVGPHKNLIVINPKKPPASKTAPAAAAVKNTQAKNPREGQDFKPGTYKGKKAHIYTHAVKNGVGAKHNIVVV